MDSLEQAREALDRIEAAIHELAGEVAPGGPEDRAWAAVNDARAALSRPVEGVKPLKWRGPDCDDEYVAFSIDKRYTILKPSDNGCRWLGGVGGYFSTVESAKAAAQADHERRILSALAAPPVADSEALRERVDGGIWLEFDYSTGEPTGVSCSVKPADARTFVHYVRAEARLAQAERGPAVTDDAVRRAGDILMQHGVNAPEQVIYQAARAALEAALHPQSAAGEEGKP